MMLRVQRLLCRKSYMHPPQRNLAPVLNGGRQRKQSEQHNPRRFGFGGEYCGLFGRRRKTYQPNIFLVFDRCDNHFYKN